MQLDQLAHDVVGFPGGSPVADRDQLDAVAARQMAQVSDGLIPASLRRVRIDRFGGDHFASCVDHCHLHARAEARIEAHGRPTPGGRGEQQVAQVGGEHAYRLPLRALPQPEANISGEMHQDPGAPRPAHRVHQPAVTGTTAVGDTEVLSHPQLIAAQPGSQRHGRARLAGLEGQAKDAFFLAPEQSQNPMRWQPGERLGEVEVVGKLGPGLLLAVPHPRFQATP